MSRGRGVDGQGDDDGMPGAIPRAWDDPYDPSMYKTGGGAWRWGDQISLNPDRAAATMVRTPTFAVPTVFLLEVDLPDISSIQAIKFVIRRAVDQLGSVVAREFTGLAAFNGVGIPRVWIGHNLSVDVALIAPFGFIDLKVACTPVCCADPTALLPTPPNFGPHGGYSSSIVSRIPASAIAVQLAGVNPNRRQLFVQNNSTQDLAVIFGGVPSLAAGAELYTMLLPGGAFSHYESPVGGYTGHVSGIWRAADATGEALVTQGTTP